MALETCFQVSSIATPTTTRATVLHAQHLFSSYKEKLSLPATRVSKRASTPLRLLGRRHRGNQFICQAKNTVDAVQVVTDANWNEVVQSQTTVLIEFWAPWCGPCRMIEPVIKELAKEYAGKLICGQVNTDDSPNIATKYGIRSIPTVLLFKDGEKKESVIGAVPKSTLSACVEKYLEV